MGKLRQSWILREYWHHTAMEGTKNERNRVF